MLTEQEINNVFSWLKDRNEWPNEMHEIENKINFIFGTLIKRFTNSTFFETFQSQDGTNSNFLEFICFPLGHDRYFGEAIMVRTSLCSSLAAYGQVYFDKTADGLSYNSITPEIVGIVKDPNLIDIETQVIKILTDSGFELINKEFAERLLPAEIDESLKKEIFYEGNQYLHGIFQIIE